MKCYTKLSGFISVSKIFLIMFIAISTSGCMAKVVTSNTDKGFDNLTNVQNMSLLIVEPIVSFENVNTNEAGRG